MSDSSDIFSNLDETFDIDIEEAPKVVNEIENQKKEIEEKVRGLKEPDQKFDLAQKEYLRLELQTLIKTNNNVLTCLSEQCTNGAPMQNFITFSKLSATLSQNIVDLINLEKTITDYRVTEKDIDLKEKSLESKEKLAETKLLAKKGGANIPQKLVQNNTYNFTGSSAEQLKMLKEKNIDLNGANNEKPPQFNLE